MAHPRVALPSAHCAFRALLFTLLLVLLSGLTSVAQEKVAPINLNGVRLWYERQGLPVPEYARGSEVAKGASGDLLSSTDGPDVRVFPSANPQTENSFAVSVANPEHLFVATNGAPTSTGTTWFFSTNGGTSWFGSETSPNNVSNSGDPVALFDLAGNAYWAALSSGLTNIKVARTTDLGATWTIADADPTGGFDDKDHAMTDLSGVYPNNVYAAWTDFNFSPGRVILTRSTDNGATWGTETQFPAGADFGHGANIAIGPNGEVYLASASYAGGVLPETGMRLAKSTDGGATWSSSSIIFPVSGIRLTNGPLAEFNFTRVSSFPSMGVDRSAGARRGWIYITYADRNTGDADVYLRRSSDGGTTWSSAMRVNGETVGNGKQQWFPSIAVDPTNGDLSVAYYSMDSTGFLTARYMAHSIDGGGNWDRVRLSDVRFTPASLPPPFSSGYMGDYYETVAMDGHAWATWSDDRSGKFQAYVSKVLYTENFGWVRGTVTSGGSPLGGVSVGFVEPDAQQAGTSAPDGGFVAGARIDTSVQSANYTLRARKFGYVDLLDTITLVRDDTVGRDFAMAVAPGGLFTGRVFRPDSQGLPANIRIRFNGEIVVDDLASDSATGLFSYPLPNGTYDITVDPPSPYASGVFPGIVVNSDTVFLSALVRHAVETSVAAVADTLGVNQSNTRSIILTNTTDVPVPFTVSLNEVPGVAAALAGVRAGRVADGGRLSAASPPQPFDGSNGLPAAGSSPSTPGPLNAGTVIRTIPAPGSVLGLTYLNGYLWAVVATSPQQLMELDPNSGAVHSSFFIGTDYHLGLTNDGTNLWVCSYSSGLVKKYTTTGTLLESWAAPNGSGVRGLAWNGSSLWIGGANTGMLYRTDPHGVVLETRTFAGSDVSWAMDMEWIPQHPAGPLWIVDAGNNDVNEFNVSVNPPVLMQDFAHPSPVNVPEGVAHDGTNLWLSAAYASQIYLVDDGISEVRWLSATPTAGQIPANDSVELVLTFDAAELIANTIYNALITLNVTHSDVSGGIVLPASLRVQPVSGPAIYVKPLVKNFGPIPLLVSRTDSLTVRNIGDSTLNITGIASTNPLFTVAPGSGTLLSGDSMKIAVTFAPVDSGPASGSVQITSNDPLNATINVSVSGTGVPVAHYASPLDSLVSVVESGTLDSLQFLVRNDGTGNGVFSARAVIYPQGTLAAGSDASPIVLPLELRERPHAAAQASLPEERAPLSPAELDANGMDRPTYDRLTERARDLPAEGASPVRSPQAALRQGAGALPFSLVEGFERTGWPWAPWTAVLSGGSTTAGCAHEGARGLQDAEWHYRTDVTVGLDGEKMSMWIKPGFGRFYAGFGASANGSWSLVAAPNTNQFIIQENANYQFNDLAAVSQTWIADVWYKLEVSFEGNGLVRGNLYGADGVTLVNTVSATPNGFAPGGIAIRCFASFCGDEVTVGSLPRWLSVAPTSGSIAQGDSLIATAYFDATTPAIFENPGTYLGRVEFNPVGAPLADSLKLQARMTVVPPPGPRLSVNKPSLKFDTVGIGSLRQLFVRVKNIGAAPLDVTGYTTSHPQYTLAPSSFSLPSLDTILVAVTFAPSAGGSLVDTLRFIANDPTPQSIALSGAGLPVPHFVTRADSLVKSMEGGLRDSVIFYVRNDGSGGGSFAARAVVTSTAQGSPLIVPMSVAASPLAPRSVQDDPDGGEDPDDAPPSTEIVGVASTQTRILSPSSGQNVLIIQNNLPWNLNIIEPFLDSLGVNVSIVTSTDFPSVNLSAFDAVIIPSAQTNGNFYSDLDAHMALLESYVQAGGVVEYHATTFGAAPKLPGSGTSIFSTDGINTVLQPAHPIVQGVPLTVHGSSASHNYLTGLPGNATIITQDGSNRPTTAEYPLGAGRVIVTGMTWEFAANLVWDFAPMLRNALTYALTHGGAAWLGIKPAAGTLALGDSTRMAATFDGTIPEIYNNPGSYYGYVEFLPTSTKRADTLRVPAHMFIQPAAGARLRVIPDSLKFGDVLIGRTSSLSLLMRNIGAAPLTVTGLTSTNPAFAVVPTSFTLNFLDTQRVYVTFTAAAPEAVQTGEILVSSNDSSATSIPMSGRSAFGIWTRQNAGTSASLFSVSIVSENVVWASGESGVTVRTTNGGATWNPYQGMSGSVDNVYGINSTNALASVNASFGDDARLYRTYDGGSSWSQIYSTTHQGAHMNSVQMFSPLLGAAVCDPGSGIWFLLRTTNGGNTWRIASFLPQVGSERGRRNAVQWLDALTGWFGTDISHLYMTTDGGTTWRSSQTPFSTTTGVSFVDGDFGMIGGGFGQTSLSTNGGKTWLLKAPAGNGDAVVPVAVPVPEPHWWAVSGPAIYRTKDRGASWQHQLSGLGTLNHIAMRFLPSIGKVIGYAVGSAGQVYRYEAAVDVKSVSVGVAPRWNLLSVPLLLADYTKTAVLPTATSYAFAFDAGFFARHRLANGRGYWAKFSASQLVTFTGVEQTVDTIEVKAGWNMVGSMGASFPVGAVGSIPGGLVTGSFYNYDGDYHPSATIEPGMGYWVKVTQAGRLIFNTAGALPAENRIRIVETGELPPPPPEGGEIAEAEVPDRYALSQNYPNPFNPSTELEYQLPVDSRVRCTVYNLMGQTVATLVDEVQPAGYRSVEWNASSAASGVYFYKLEATSVTGSGQTFTEVKKMVLLK